MDVENQKALEFLINYEKNREFTDQNNRYFRTSDIARGVSLVIVLSFIAILVLSVKTSSRGSSIGRQITFKLLIALLLMKFVVQ